MATLGVDDWALRKIELDNADQTIPDVLIANEGDAKGRGIDLRFTQGGVAASMAGMAVYLAWGHEQGAQGLTPFTAVDASKGRFKVYYPEQMQRAGTVIARVLVYVGAKTPITGSRVFRIFVESNPIDESAAITTDDFSVFKLAVIDLNTAKANADAATKKAADAATKATNSAKSADTATANANVATKNANDAAKDAADASGEAIKAAKSANDAAKDASASSDEADAATLKADAATRNAANAASQAQGAAGNANAAANAALQIANSIASNNAGEGDIADMRAQIEVLGHQVAELSGAFVLIGSTIYAPSSKASLSGTTVTLPTSTISGTTITLS